MEPPFLRQLWRQLSLKGLGNVFSNVREELECTARMLVSQGKDSVGYILSSPAGSDEQIGMIRMIIEDKVARRRLIIPAQACLLEPSFYQLRQDLLETCKQSLPTFLGDEVCARGDSLTGW